MSPWAGRLIRRCCGSASLRGSLVRRGRSHASPSRPSPSSSRLARGADWLRRRPRVFSLLKQLFGDQQLSSLMDYIQGSIMLTTTIAPSDPRVVDEDVSEHRPNSCHSAHTGSRARFRSSCVPSLPAGLGGVGSVRREGVESKKFRETFAKVGLGSRERKKESWAILKESLMWAYVSLSSERMPKGRVVQRRWSHSPAVRLPDFHIWCGWLVDFEPAGEVLAGGACATGISTAA